MKRRTIRFLIILAVVSLLGIVFTQIYWFKQAFNKETDQFDRDVNTALFNVASQFFALNNTVLPSRNPIEQLSTNYYVVMINSEIDANLLEHLLKAEFEKRNITADFEYGIYDCSSERMVYGNYVSNTKSPMVASSQNLPKWENQNYYFGVQFPNKASIITNRMGIWIFSSAVLLIVIIFFSYALFVILKQKRLSEIQKDFINNMTHEFKTPISTIALSTEVLKDPNIAKQPDRLKNYAAIIENENLRLKHQVERVLQMATLDKEEIVLKSQEINIHEIIYETKENMLLSLGQGKGNITCHLQADHAVIRGDILHITNVFYNLLDNAIKYNKRNPDITIDTYNTQDEICIAIEDNGIGISKQDQGKIFNQFYRVPSGNVHDVKGFGIGLNYVNIVIKAHRGKITINSEPGKGSTFKLFFKNA